MTEVDLPIGRIWPPMCLWLLEEYALNRKVLIYVHRTLHGSLTPVGSGTMGHLRGVDFHIEIHCMRCCCRPTNGWSCQRQPAVVAPYRRRDDQGWREVAEREAENHRLARHPDDAVGSGT